MIKRLALTLALLVICLSAFAEPSLLLSSILSCTHEELVAMSIAYGLDPTLEDDGLRDNLMDYFFLEEEEQSTGEAQELETNSITITNADQVFSLDDVVVLTGNVRVAFTLSDEEGQREFVADKVVVDLENKIVQASGSVSLTDGTSDDRTFSGQMICLDWGKLDVVVFDGVSTTSRDNSDGTTILFYAAGESIAYDGDNNGIFFNNGIIATTDDDPYWSIEAKKLSLVENDFFVDRATFKLGRVPIFWFPIFFYPGTTLSFNPAIGYSSEYGAFINTTFEVYGKYPGLGVVGTKSGSDDSDYSASITSFLETENESEMIRDGWYYRARTEEDELSELETWARENSNYLAVFSDAYEDLGVVLGFDTLNKLLDSNLVISSVGAAGYTPNPVASAVPRFRYSLDFDMAYTLDSLKVNLKLPVYSDPDAPVDFLNRNTAFSMDSAFGSTQYFPSTYSSKSSYTWLVNASYSKSVGSFNFTLDSLKADMDFKLDKKLVDGDYLYQGTVTEASLPYLSISSNGTFLDLRGQSTSTTKTLSYTNDLAISFDEEYKALQADGVESVASEDDLVPYSGPDLDLEETTTSSAGSLKLGYTYSQSLDNVYKEDLVHSNFYTKLNGSLYLKAEAPGQWFSLSETVRPKFNFSVNDIDSTSTQIDEFYLTSELSASIPKLGITYNLNQSIYSHYNSVSGSTEKLTDRWGQWDSTDVTAHNASISKKLGHFTLGFYAQFVPLTEILRPSVRFSDSGFTASADFSFQRPADSDTFEKGVGNLNLAYSNSYFLFSVNNKYDFTKGESNAWDGYSLTQKLSVTPIKGLVFTENSSFAGQFVAQKLSMGVAYSLDANLLDLSTSASMSFAGEDYDKDAFNFKLSLSQEELVFWRGRVGFDTSAGLNFNYDFQDPYRTSLSANLSFDFKIAEFLDLSLSINSSNNSFSRYYSSGSLDLSAMFDDLLRSFDFFGTGRYSTGFNLSSFSLKAVHYMRDWNLYIDATGSLTSKYGNKYQWVPTVTVYIKWNAIPELKTQGTWNSYTKEWE